jgi:hypothetical protein
MDFKEIEQSIAAHDRQIDAVIGLLASLAERLDSLVRVAEIQNRRITRL